MSSFEHFITKTIFGSTIRGNTQTNLANVNPIFYFD